MNEELEQTTEQPVEQTEAPVEQTAEGAEEQTAPLSARDTLFNNLKTKYADRGYETEDDYYNAMMSDYDAEHEWNKQTRADNEELAKRLKEDPYVAAFLVDILQGTHPAIAFKEAFPEGFLEINEGDEAYDAYNKMVADRKSRAEADQAAIAEYDKNLEASQPILEEYAQRTGRNPEQMSEFFSRFSKEIVEPIMQGRIDMGILSAIDKAFGYDEDIKSAEEQGRIGGRNESILERHRSLQPQGDLPSLQSGGANQTQEQQPESPFAALARERGNTQFFQ